MRVKSQTIVEQQIRELIDAWQILGKLGLVDTIFNHISVVVEDRSSRFRLLINPEGKLPKELAREDICMLPLRKYRSSEAKHFGINPDALYLHSSIHQIRMKPGVIVHTHSVYSLAVSCSKQGLLPLSQTAIEFSGDLRVIDYGGMFRSQSLTKPLAGLATDGGVALLRNHGTLVIADNVSEAFYLSYYIEEACRIQVLALSQGIPLVVPDRASIVASRKTLRHDRPRAAAQLFESFRRNKGI